MITWKNLQMVSPGFENDVETETEAAGWETLRVVVP